MNCFHCPEIFCHLLYELYLRYQVMVHQILVNTAFHFQVIFDFPIALLTYILYAMPACALGGLAPNGTYYWPSIIAFTVIIIVHSLLWRYISWTISYTFDSKTSSAAALCKYHTWNSYRSRRITAQNLLCCYAIPKFNTLVATQCDITVRKYHHHSVLGLSLRHSSL